MPVARTPSAAVRRSTRSASRGRSSSRSSSRSKSPSKSPARSRSASKDKKKKAPKKKKSGGEAGGGGKNWVDGGLGDGTLMVPFLLVFAPWFVQVLAYLTSPEGKAEVAPELGLHGLLYGCAGAGDGGVGGYLGCFWSHLSDVCAKCTPWSGMPPTWAAAKFLLGFNALALLLDVGLPGKVETGPETLTGHVPKYVNNSLLHCFIFSALFVGGSNLCPLSGADGSLGAMLYPPSLRYDFGIVYDVFPGMISCLNIFGMALAVFLYYKVGGGRLLRLDLSRHTNKPHPCLPHYSAWSHD